MHGAVADFVAQKYAEPSPNPCSHRRERGSAIAGWHRRINESSKDKPNGFLRLSKCQSVSPHVARLLECRNVTTTTSRPIIQRYRTHDEETGVTFAEPRGSLTAADRCGSPAGPPPPTKPDFLDVRSQLSSEGTRFGQTGTLAETTLNSRRSGTRRRVPDGV